MGTNSDESSSGSIDGARKKQVAFVGFVFFVLFTAFNLTQALTTSVFAHEGSYSLAILYISFALGSLVIPFITFKFGSKLSLVFGSFGYFGFVLGAATKNIWLLLVGSVLCGVGASLLWIGQGVYVSEVAGGEQKTLGVLGAVFWIICNSNMVPGPLISGFLVKSGVISISILLWILAVISFLSCVLMAFIKGNPKREMKDDEKPSVLKIFSEFRNVRVILLLPCFAFQGFSITFTFGMFPTLMEVNEIPFVFLTYGLSSLVGAYVTGICLDKFGWKPVAFVSVALYSTGYVLAFIGKWKNFYWFFYFAGCCLGLVDAEINTKVNWFIMRMYEHSSPAFAFAAYRFTMASTCALGFIVLPFIYFAYAEIVIIFFLVVATACYFAIDSRFLRSKDLPEIQKEEETPSQVVLEES